MAARMWTSNGDGMHQSKASPSDMSKTCQRSLRAPRLLACICIALLPATVIIIVFYPSLGKGKPFSSSKTSSCDC